MTVKPVRTSGWSSTTRTRSGLVGSTMGRLGAGSQREACGHPETATALAGGGVQRPLEGVQPLAHADQTSATSHGVWPVAATIVDHIDTQLGLAPVQDDRHPARGGVLDGV